MERSNSIFVACCCKFGSFSLHMDTIALWEPMYFWFRNAQSNPSHATSENAFLKEIQDVLYSPNPMVKKTTQLPTSCDTLPACMRMCSNLFWIWWQGMARLWVQDGLDDLMKLCGLACPILISIGVEVWTGIFIFHLVMLLLWLA
jgi:hypothetical protein